MLAPFGSLILPTYSDVGCKTVANMIKGKQPEEIRKLWVIKTFSLRIDLWRMCTSGSTSSTTSLQRKKLKSERRTNGQRIDKRIKSNPKFAFLFIFTSFVCFHQSIFAHRKVVRNWKPSFSRNQSLVKREFPSRTDLTSQTFWNLISFSCHLHSSWAVTKPSVASHLIRPPVPDRVPGQLIEDPRRLDALRSHLAHLCGLQSQRLALYHTIWQGSIGSLT